MLRVLDLFSGIGAYALGVERAGMKVVAFCECEEFPQQVLRKHWPDVPIYDDVRTLTADTLRRDGIAVDVIVGGWPCQDLSFAGPRRGLDGERSGLWSEVARLIGELRPCYAILENSTGLLSSSPDGEPPGRDFGRVLGDLAQIRYDAEWHCLLAAGFDAPHLRDRLWIVAYPQYPDANNAGSHRAPEHIEREAELRHEQECQLGSMGANVSNADDTRLAKRSRVRGNSRTANKTPFERTDSTRGAYVADVYSFAPFGAAIARTQRHTWDPEPDVDRVAARSPLAVDRIKALGNCNPPIIPETIARAVIAHHETRLKSADGIKARGTLNMDGESK